MRGSVSLSCGISAGPLFSPVPGAPGRGIYPLCLSHCAAPAPSLVQTQLKQPPASRVRCPSAHRTASEWVQRAPKSSLTPRMVRSCWTTTLLTAEEAEPPRAGATVFPQGSSCLKKSQLPSSSPCTIPNDRREHLCGILT